MNSLNFSITTLLSLLSSLIIAQERINPSSLKLNDKSITIKANTFFKDNNGYWDSINYIIKDRLEIEEYSLNDKKYYTLITSHFFQRGDHKYRTTIFTQDEFFEFKNHFTNYNNKIKTVKCFISRPHPINNRDLTGLIRGTHSLKSEPILFKIVSVNNQKFVRLSVSNSIKSFNNKYLEIPLIQFLNLFETNTIETKNTVENNKQLYTELTTTKREKDIQKMDLVTDSICNSILLDYLPRYKQNEYNPKNQLFKQTHTHFAKFAIIKRKHWDFFNNFSLNTESIDTILLKSDKIIKNHLGFEDSVQYIILHDLYGHFGRISKEKWEEGILVTSNGLKKIKTNIRRDLMAINPKESSLSRSVYQDLLIFEYDSISYISINKFKAKEFKANQNTIDKLEKENTIRIKENERKRLEKEKHHQDSIKLKSITILNQLGKKYVGTDSKGKKIKCSVFLNDNTIYFKTQNQERTIKVNLLSLKPTDNGHKLSVSGNDIYEIHIDTNNNFHFKYYNTYTEKIVYTLK